MNTGLAAKLPALAKFAIGMCVLMGIPAVCRRLRFPAAVGLLLFGIIIGPHALDLFGESRPVADFFAELGKLLLMFFAGLEIDLALFKKARRKSITFGLLTTGLPLLLGTLAGLIFGYSPVAAVVIGSLLASHTLLGSSTITRLGLLRVEPVTITFGATMMSDTLSLIVFAICLSIYQTGFSARAIGIQLAEIVIVIPLMAWSFSRLAAVFGRRVKDQEDAQFIFLLGIVAIAGLIAQSINLPGIVGAFLAGLSVNAAVRDSAAKEKLEFLGNSLFVPSFFVVTGFIIDPKVFAQSLWSKFPLALSVVGALLLGKWLAADLISRLYGYSKNAKLTIWSLTLPQVAATLAAALVAYQTHDPAGKPLVDEQLLNVVFVLMLTTSILGPVLTDRFAPRLLAEGKETGASGLKAAS